MSAVSIIQPWVENLGLREQGTLVASIRGCDGTAKGDITKALMREIRGLILVPFDAREMKESDKGFINPFPSPSATTNFPVLLKSLDQYPVHFLFHMLFAIEVIGYRHPQPVVRAVYLHRYEMIVRKLHLNPETLEQFVARMTEDRIANGTVEG